MRVARVKASWTAAEQGGSEGEGKEVVGWVGSWAGRGETSSLVLRTRAALQQRVEVLDEPALDPDGAHLLVRSRSSLPVSALFASLRCRRRDAKGRGEEGRTVK